MTLFRDPSGKASMTRTVAFMLSCATTLFLLAVGAYLLRPTPSASVLTAVGGVLTAVLGAIFGALTQRTTPSDPTSSPPNASS